MARPKRIESKKGLDVYLEAYIGCICYYNVVLGDGKGLARLI
jgi:hypothetical protein